MVDIENNFILQREYFIDEIKQGKRYQLIIPGQINYIFIGREVPLWFKEGNGKFGMDEVGKAIINEATHIPGDKPGETNTRIKFRIISLKENGLGRKVQT